MGRAGGADGQARRSAVSGLGKRSLWYGQEELIVIQEKLVVRAGEVGGQARKSLWSL